MSVSTDEFRTILEKADHFDEIASIFQKNLTKKEIKKEICCSFCGKHQTYVVKIVAGPGVYICNECVNLCKEIINEELEHELVDGSGI